MRVIRFGLIGIVSFIIATGATIFVSGSFLNRLFLAASCTILSFNSVFCTPNLGEKSDRVMATSISSIEKMRNVYGDLPQQESIEIENKRTLLAFDSFNIDEGHRGITKAATKVNWMTVLGEQLNFTPEAITEIERANRSVDLKPEFLDSTSITSIMGSAVTKASLPFSDDFYIPSNHFDRETFLEASGRLKNIKNLIVNILKPIVNAKEDDAKQRGKKARELLGHALHTVQDFYAHTNWVELGFDENEIDTRLGREIIKNPPQCVYPNPTNKISMCTSEPVSDSEIMEAFKHEHKNYSVPLLTSSFSALTAAELMKYTLLASSLSDKPGILKKEFTKYGNPKNKEFLTSGYFMDINHPCAAPRGKTRHGFITCNGLNKDNPSITGYNVAFKQAVKASQDYIIQIIREESDISFNTEAIKSLMGYYAQQCTPSDNQSKSEKNQTNKECEQKQGSSTGDPHLATFDGLRYDLQTVGEFILVKSNDGAFEVQARHTPFNNSASISMNSAVAMKVGSDRVALYAQDLPDADTSTPLRVNGKPITIQGGKLALNGGGEILQQGNTYVVNSPTGEKVVVAANNGFFNISPFVYKQSERYSGLLGNVNGDPNDDQQIRGGGNVLKVQSTYGDVNKVLNGVGLRVPGVLDRAEQVYFDQLYKQFANSWRVKQEESLFDYPVGKTTKNYLDPTFPDKYLKLDMLSADQIQTAKNACIEAKVTQDLIEGCIFDVGFSGFSEFARTTAQINGYIDIVNKLFPGLNLPKPEKTVFRWIDKFKPKVCFLGRCL